MRPDRLMTEQLEAASPEIAQDADAGIAELATPNGVHQGMGVLIAPRHVLTCAHVVNAALGRKAEDLNMPTWSDVIWLSFPFAVRPTRLIGRVIEWRPVGSLRGDAAVLQLDTEAPPEVGIAIVAQSKTPDLSGHALSVFGKAAGAVQGVRIAAAFMGQATYHWRQIDAVGNAGVFVRGGYSGAAVWDAALKAVVGMIVARYVSDTEKIAFMIPIGEFATLARDTPMETRNASTTFDPIWTSLGFMTLLLMVSHWAVDRSAMAFAPLTISGSHWRLSAFWGMHLGAVLPGLLAGMLYWYARSFHLHKWFARIPRLGLARRIPDGSASKGAGVFTLCVMLLLFGLQIHFIRRFNVEGHVYIHPIAFGYTAEEYRAIPDTWCSPDPDPSVHVTSSVATHSFRPNRA
jgi:hypothetical protein